MKHNISKKSIKETFDNLPVAICYFSKDGLPVLCNRQMHGIVHAMTGRDLQLITDLTVMLDSARQNSGNIDGNIIVLPNGTAWQFRKSIVTAGEDYTQYIAANITDIYRQRKDLQLSAAQYGEMVEDIKKITENVVAITREKEILEMKMNIHNGVGVCLQRLRRYYGRKDPRGEKAKIAAMIREVADVLHGEVGKDDTADILGELRDIAQSLGVTVEMKGDMPKGKNAEKLIAEAIRECITNTLKHAGGNKLFVELKRHRGGLSATIRNNGAQPQSTIVEGGGLSSLRKEIEQAGGIMTVRSLPGFELEVTLNNID